MNKKDFLILAMGGMLSASNDVYGAPLLPANDRGKIGALYRRRRNASHASTSAKDLTEDVVVTSM